MFQNSQDAWMLRDPDDYPLDTYLVRAGIWASFLNPTGLGRGRPQTCPR
ncbi:MAG: hypothetical protein R3C20_05875 [Planctomycetaceae bacterium]